MIGPFQPERQNCPICGIRIVRLGGGHGVPPRCPHCYSEVHIPISYGRWIWLLIVVALAAAGAATYDEAHAGTWLLLLILCSIPVRVVLGILIPPYYAVGKYKRGIPFLFWYVSYAVTMPVVVTAWGWLHVLVGASKSEISDAMVAMSLPLGWIDSALIMNTDRSFLDICGIVVGNSFFYAVATFALWRGARAMIHRNRVTVINITGDKTDDEGD